MAELLSTGRDTWCVDQLMPGRFATGTRLVAQRCYHRLTTPAGSLRGGEDEADFGFDLSAYIGATEDRELAAMLPGRVRNELMKDPTVANVTVRATRSVSAGAVTWTLAIHVESGAGPFDLLVAASDVTVALLEVT